MSLKQYLALFGLLCLGASSAPTDKGSSTTTDALPRIFVCTDISNEPDDQMSLVRLLVHSDIVSIQGISTTTSYWLNNTTYPEHILDVISAYENVTTNLNAHSENRFPTAEELRPLVKAGHSAYGLAALNNGTLSSGAELLISSVNSSEETLYVLLWGGANVLAEALHHINLTSTPSQLSSFTKKLHVYSISDQDNSGPWIRKHFPSITYIASVHGWNMYNNAAWTGISGDLNYGFDLGGPNTSLVSPDYIRTHFQIGPLGAKYPDVEYIMEGDSPSLLYVLPNGLGVPSHPEYGSWGGRYILSDISGASYHYADTVDRVTGSNGNTFVSNKATIWRWRQAYQNEMSARMQWTLSSNYSSAVHPPKVVVNGSAGLQPLNLQAEPEEKIKLIASRSEDMDGKGLTFEWMHYKDITATNNWNVGYKVPQLNFTCLDELCSSVESKMPTRDLACPKGKCDSYHVILSVTGAGENGMTRYKRVILDMQESSQGSL